MFRRASLSLLHGSPAAKVPQLRMKASVANCLPYLFDQISKTAELLTNRGVVQQVNQLKYCDSTNERS